MGAGNDFEGTVCFAARIKVNSDGDHAFENECGRLDVENIGLD